MKTTTTALLFILLLASCSTSSRAVRQLSNLNDDVKQNSEHYTMQQWKQAVDRYKTVNTKIEYYAMKGKYSPQEMEQIGRLQGECVAEMAKGAGKGVLNKANLIGKNIEGVLEGIGSALGF